MGGKTLAQRVLATMESETSLWESKKKSFGCANKAAVFFSPSKSLFVCSPNGPWAFIVLPLPLPKL